MQAAQKYVIDAIKAKEPELGQEIEDVFAKLQIFEDEGKISSDVPWYSMKFNRLNNLFERFTVLTIKLVNAGFKDEVSYLARHVMYTVKALAPNPPS